jgi:hypothetical protein
MDTLSQIMKSPFTEMIVTLEHLGRGGSEVSLSELPPPQAHRNSAPLRTATLHTHNCLGTRQSSSDGPRMTINVLCSDVHGLFVDGYVGPLEPAIWPCST